MELYAEIPSARTPGRLNFAWWCLIFVGHQYRTGFVSPLLCPRILNWLLNFWEICASLRNVHFSFLLCTFLTLLQKLLKHVTFVLYCIWSIHILVACVLNYALYKVACFFQNMVGDLIPVSSDAIELILNILILRNFFLFKCQYIKVIVDLKFLFVN